MNQYSNVTKKHLKFLPQFDILIVPNKTVYVVTRSGVYFYLPVKIQALFSHAFSGYVEVLFGDNRSCIFRVWLRLKLRTFLF